MSQKGVIGTKLCTLTNAALAGELQHKEEDH